MQRLPGKDDSSGSSSPSSDADSLAAFSAGHETPVEGENTDDERAREEDAVESEPEPEECRVRAFGWQTSQVVFRTEISLNIWSTKRTHQTSPILPQVIK